MIMDIQERVTRLEERLTGMHSNLTAIKAEMGVQTAMLTQLVAQENRRKGAISALLRVGGLIGSGGLLTTLIAWWTNHVK